VELILTFSHGAVELAFRAQAETRQKNERPDTQASPGQEEDQYRQERVLIAQEGQKDQYPPGYYLDYAGGKAMAWFQKNRA